MPEAVLRSAYDRNAVRTRQLVELGVAEPMLVAGWTYAVRFGRHDPSRAQ